MHILMTGKKIYIVPVAQVEPFTLETSLMDKFTHGDPKGTGITIDVDGDDSDDTNLANDAFWDD